MIQICTTTEEEGWVGHPIPSQVKNTDQWGVVGNFCSEVTFLAKQND